MSMYLSPMAKIEREKLEDPELEQILTDLEDFAREIENFKTEKVDGIPKFPPLEEIPG